MTRVTQEDREWASIGATLEHCWPNSPFTGSTTKAYRAALGAFPASVVAHSIQNIVSRGVPRTAHSIDKQRRPAAPEIAEECRIIMGLAGGDETFDAPSFVEIERVVCNEAWDPSASVGAAIVLEKAGPVAEAWFLAGGRHLIRSQSLGDDPKGYKIAAVAKSYRDFVDTQRERKARGLTVAAVVGGQVERGGLRVQRLREIGQ